MFTLAFHKGKGGDGKSKLLMFYVDGIEIAIWIVEERVLISSVQG